MSEQLRSRRSNLAVPGSSPKMLDKAQGPGGRPGVHGHRGRGGADGEAGGADEHRGGSERGRLRGARCASVRVNDWTTPWTYTDVIEVVGGAGANLDCIMLPKVQTAEQVVALDLLLTQVEKSMGFEVGRIGIEAQIENALRADQRGRDRAGVAAGGDDHLRAGGFHGEHQHEVARGRRAAARATTSATRTTTS